MIFINGTILKVNWINEKNKCSGGFKKKKIKGDIQTVPQKTLLAELFSNLRYLYHETYWAKGENIEN